MFHGVQLLAGLTEKSHITVVLYCRLYFRSRFPEGAGRKQSSSKMKQFSSVRINYAYWLLVSSCMYVGLDEKA